jgi:hypothetical protein
MLKMEGTSLDAFLLSNTLDFSYGRSILAKVCDIFASQVHPSPS